MLKHTPTISDNDIERETKAIISVLISRYQNDEIDENELIDRMQRVRGYSDEIQEKLYRMQQMVAIPECM